MTKQEWLTAGIVAACVAVLTVGLIAPPMCWAGPARVFEVPALPSTQLSIPTIHAQVAATATPAPGQTVLATLSLTSPAGMSLTPVPVAISVLRTEMNPMARSMPRPQQVAFVQTSVPVGTDGKGSVAVALPMTWAIPASAAAIDTTNAKSVRTLKSEISYQMVLSSPLGGKAAPFDLQSINIGNGTQQVNRFQVSPTLTVNLTSPTMVWNNTARPFDPLSMMRLGLDNNANVPVDTFMQRATP